ncbi:MAG: ABC transporter ATP-binding protein [Myxococcota bacterium]|nr:ABC transporter ATP-binding protein [Myxococcota bacterium]
MSFLELRGLQKTYADGTQAVRGVDLSVDEGELIVLLGPSGCGKTTTLRMVAGLELATEGSIHLRGDDVTLLRPSQRDVGMVFQFYALYPHLTVRENIAFPLRAAGVAPSEIRGRVEAVAERMDLGELLSFYPRQLSGGDQQKVSLARAIVRRPAVYLMDEPLGTLDADQRLAMRELIRGEQQASKVTTIYVTHDQEEAMSLADRVVVMAGGRIRQVGTPGTVYDRPADLFVASFVGSPGMNFISGQIKDGNGKPVFVSEVGRVPIDVPPLGGELRSDGAGKATLGIRCEHVHEEAEGPLVGHVLTEEYLGSARHVHVQTQAGRLVMRTASSPSRARGSELRLRLDPAQISVFDVATEKRL